MRRIFVRNLFLTQLQPYRLFPTMAGVAQALLEGPISVEAKVAAWLSAVAKMERSGVREGGAGP